MNYLLIFALPLALVADLCLCIKAGFIVGEWTEDTGFDAGFYMLTVIGLIAAQIALAAYLLGIGV